MVNSLEKTYTFILEPQQQISVIRSLMKNMTVYVQWKCTWIKEDDCYFPTNIILEKVWRDSHPDDNQEENTIQSSWEANELEPALYEYFNSGLALQAEIEKNLINF